MFNISTWIKSWSAPRIDQLVAERNTSGVLQALTARKAGVRTAAANALGSLIPLLREERNQSALFEVFDATRSLLARDEMPEGLSKSMTLAAIALSEIGDQRVVELMVADLHWEHNRLTRPISAAITLAALSDSRGGDFLASTIAADKNFEKLATTFCAVALLQNMGDRRGLISLLEMVNKGREDEQKPRDPSRSLDILLRGYGSSWADVLSKALNDQDRDVRNLANRLVKRPSESSHSSAAPTEEQQDGADMSSSKKELDNSAVHACVRCGEGAVDFRCIRCDRTYCEPCIRTFGEKAARVLIERVHGAGATFGTAKIFDEKGRAFCPECYGSLLDRAQRTGQWVVRSKDEMEPSCERQEKRTM